MKLLSTNYPELFAAELLDVVSWGTLHPADLHVTIQEQVREDYLAYKLERRMQSVQEMLTTTLQERRCVVCLVLHTKARSDCRTIRLL